MTQTGAKILWATMAGALLWGMWILADGTRPYLRGKAPVQVEIQRGTSISEIARQLQEVGVIRSTQTFLWLHYLRPGQTLKAGEYAFPGRVSTLEVLRKLIRGDVDYELLTIPEGYNRFEIADAVSAQGLATREEFLEASAAASLLADLDPEAADLEGYLFPDSYHFSPRAGAAGIVQAMVDRFREVYSSLAPTGEKRPVREIVTMASLVEKEAKEPEERPLIAAVFYNRLERRILLQCDPTVIYAAMLEGRYDGKIRQSHLDSPSPYNTYRRRGLPPGPIANPGKASLSAALRPASSDYLYFVVNHNGGHTFSRTLREHNRAVSLYRRGRSQ